MDRKILVKEYVGKNYEKFYEKNFSLPAFFFGGLYFIYRKLIVEGIILFLSMLILVDVFANIMGQMVIFIPTIILMALAISLVFNTRYRTVVNKRVSRILKNNTEASEKQLIEMAKKQGGTSIIYVILLLIIGGAIIGFTVNAINKGFETIDKAVIYAEEYNKNKEEEEAKEKDYKGLVLKADVSINIEDVIDVKVPSKFKNITNEKYLYKYSYTEDQNAKYDNVDFYIEVVEGFSNKQNLVDAILGYYQIDKEEVEINTINDIEWNTIVVNSEYGTYIYNVAEKEGKVYLYEYEIDNDVSGNEMAIKNYEKVMNSIKIK